MNDNEYNDDYNDSIMVGHQGRAPAARPAMVPAEQAAAFAERLLASQTPAQAAIARQIYGRMKAGADVDDVRDLIEQLSATRTRRPSAAGWSTPERDHELRLYEDE